ncbi:S8 family serine peptidase [Algibacillus agarilyticus]|uniref:S8 family serine peptidase n=1 Tax=Algibacillus agarilyticus TaxID=2234133 RepID=UPI00130085CA|nr:S8 family serine peptidase [Algibacillus agarilyticus]
MQANVLDAPVLNDGLPSLTEPLTDKINNISQTIQSAERAMVLERIAEQSKQFSAASLGSLADLPRRVNIPSVQGEPLVEVEVEHGWRAIEQEWLVMVTDQELNQITLLTQENMISLVTLSRFEQLALTLIKFKAAKDYDSFNQLSLVLPVSVLEKLGRNHVYSAQANHHETKKSTAQIKDHTARLRVNAVFQAPISIGMIDTAIDLTHPAFKKGQVTSQHFLADEHVAPKAHGTAVAALLIGHNTEQPALLPNAKLFAASVFHSQTAYAQGATLFNLLNGLEWLLANQVSVINMSLAGPPNPILAQVVTQVQNKNITIIAAAGNEGPAAPPLYPAVYQKVITATAVDELRQSYRWSNRGEHIDYAAFGVSVLTARVGNKWGRESGTSIATPIVSAFVACAKHQSPHDFLPVLHS